MTLMLKVNCRACNRKSDEFKHLLKETIIDDEVKTFAALLNYCTTIEGFGENHESGMPQHICNICVEHLLQSYLFKKMVLRNETDNRERLQVQKQSKKDPVVFVKEEQVVKQEINFEDSMEPDEFISENVEIFEGNNVKPEYKCKDLVQIDANYQFADCESINMQSENQKNDFLENVSRDYEENSNDIVIINEADAQNYEYVNCSEAKEYNYIDNDDKDEKCAEEQLAENLNENKDKQKRKYIKNKSKFKKYKKWTDCEIKKIIKYLADNRKIEQPTAQMYYNKFLDEYKIDATWMLVKWKVRYLKTCFGNAEKWRKNTGAGILDEDLNNGVNTVNAKLRKMCGHYERLKDIFGNTRESEVDFDSSQSSVDFFGFDCTDEDLLIKPSDDILIKPSVSTPKENTTELCAHNLSQPSTRNKAQQSKRTEKVSNFVEKLKKVKEAKDSNTQLTIYQRERNDTQRLKLELDERNFETEFEFQKRKFETEISVKKQELDLRKLEIEKNEKLKILELEKNERIAKYELDLKYKK